MEQEKKERKLKSLNKRKPETILGMAEMTKSIMLETGFREADIGLVIRTMVGCIKDAMIEGNGVSINKLGIFYPLIKPSRTVMSMNGGVGKPTRMTMDARRQMKFRTSDNINSALLEEIPTKEEVDNLYQD